jgi:hypothetical protein
VVPFLQGSVSRAGRFPIFNTDEDSGIDVASLVPDNLNGDTCAE